MEQAGEGAEEEWDFEAEWASYQSAGPGMEEDAGGPAVSQAPISAYSLLYTGFFAGPAATFLAIFVLMERDFRPRIAVFSLGVCAAIWLMIQGFSVWLAGFWLPWQVQILRTLFNLVAGSICLGFWLRAEPRRPARTPQFWLNTGVFLLFLILLFGFLPADLLFWLGR